MTDFRSLVPTSRYQPTLAVAPDGTAVAYSCNASGRYDLWLHPLAGGDRRRLTGLTGLAVRQAAFAPAGDRLVFIADRDGDEQHQVYLVDADGEAEPAQLTDDKAQFNLPAAPFSADGRRLAFAGNDRDPGAQDLLIADPATGTRRRIQAPPGLIAEPAGFAPDGERLLVWALRGGADTDLFLLDLRDPDAGLDPLTAHTGDEVHEAGPWAADGSGFHEITDAGSDRRALVFHDLALGTGGPLSCADWDVEQVASSRDGAVLAWTENQDGVSVLRVLREGAVVPVSGVPAGKITNLAVSADGRVLAFLLDSAARPTEVCVVDGERFAFRYLTDSRPPALASGRVTPINPELVSYPTHDGRRVSALLYRPAGPGPFPLVVSVHGGPEDQERPVYRYAGLYQYLLAAGVAVVAPNVRGSTGYGAAYQKLIHRDWGGGELGDLEHTALYARALPWVDPARIGVFGASFGGFAALSCLSRLPQYWAAGVSVVGPSNLITYAGAVPPTWRPLMAAWIGDPQDDADLLAERSPLTYADRITAPLFVIHGARDPRVARAESDQIVQSVRSRGIPVRYDVFEDEGHGFTKRDNEIRAWESVGDYLVETLGGAR